MEKEIVDYTNYLKLKDQSVIYLNPIKIYLRYCIEKKIDYLTVDFRILSDFLLEKKDTYSKGYINNFICSIKSFYNFLKDYNYPLKENVIGEVSKLRQIPRGRTLRQVVNLRELDEGIKNLINWGYRLSPYKIKAIVYFIFYTGIRRGELLNFKRENIDLSDCSAIVRTPTKNREERTVFFPSKVRDILAICFKMEPEITNAFNITDGELKGLFIHLRNFNKKIKAHTLRHSYTELLASKGFDIRVAQKLLGHKSIQSTMLYYNPTTATCRELYRKKIK